MLASRSKQLLAHIVISSSEEGLHKVVSCPKACFTLEMQIECALPRGICCPAYLPHFHYLHQHHAQDIYQNISALVASIEEIGDCPSEGILSFCLLGMLSFLLYVQCNLCICTYKC